MTLASGTRLGPYEIVGPLGAGGMGEVYRAKDPRLGREVAIKVLPASLSGDADRLHRFEQEARSASGLNHPNIIAIYDIGRSDSTSYIAMELVEGASLRVLLASGPLPTRKLLEVSAQIADGLAKAHGAGIVHRDLKPENVMVSKDGFVKLLDFGLAKLFVAPTEQTSAAATIAPQETQPGTVLGTVGYMSPEQASGRAMDFRSDQFALGSILYEMATGRRAFQKPTGAETLSAIIRDEPESVERLNPRAPAPLRWIVERCLSKDPEERYASTRDLARDLKAIRDHLSETTSPSAAHEREPLRKSAKLKAAAIVAGLLAAGLLGALAGRRLGGASQPTFQRLTFQRGTVVAARFGPDGQTVYYGAAWEGSAPRIFTLRPGVPESSALALPGANLLAISPSGEMLIQLDPRGALSGFALVGTLARVPLAGGAPREMLTDVSYADWSPGGSDLAVVHRVAGKERLEFPIGRVLYETAGWIQGPRFSPDGRQIAFIDHPGSGDDGAIAVVDLAGKKSELAPGWSTVQGLAWEPKGREVWFTAAQQGIEREIFGVTLSGRLRLIRTMQGTPALLDLRADGSALVTEDDYRSSMMAFLPGQSAGKDLSWFDWSSDRCLSSDGKLALFDESGEGGGAAGGVYLRPTDGAPAVRLTDGFGVALSPDTSRALARTLPDPSHFVVVPVRTGQPREFPPDGLGRPPYGTFFPDGERFVFEASAPGKGTRLYVQALSGGSPRPISDEGINPTRLFVSPDSQWIAAVGPDTRVHLYPASGGSPRDLPASRAGDYPAGWSNDGKGLYVSRIGIPCSVDLLDIASGARTHVRDLAGSDPAGVTSFGPARVTPDGKTMTIGLNRVLSTLYRIRDLK
ncbi:MAG TPA: protein kinase [Thermoanaerobaculia bacterium]|nr:protein kinase [Thermoanaerobaculia bacterium]